jgi:hypothetical protein
MSVKVDLVSKNLNTTKRQQKAIEAAHCLELILNSKQFKDMMLNMDDRWRLGSTGKFKYMPNHEIYNYIMSGKEEWNGVVDNEIDIIVDDYTKSWSSVIGYMIPMKPTTWVNTKFFDSNALINVVSNFLHEYFHHLGMRHGGDDFRSSIPYFANYIVEEIFYEVCNEEPPEYKKVCSRSWKTLWLRKTCRWVKVN